MKSLFSDRELDVMKILWERGEATVAEVRDRMPGDLNYNTVLTNLRILHGKGHVGYRAEGRTFFYHALVERDSAERSIVQTVLDRLFGGSAAMLMAHLARDPDLSAEELERMQSLLRQTARDKQG